MGNRLVYVEPNDIVKDHIQATNTNSDYTWNPEDLSLYVDLQVVVPNRNDCGEEPSDVQNTTYVSLMEGVKIGDSKVLTTDYINVSYNEIKNNNVSSKEALGITSIDITFDAHFYPRVQINFTDVRAYSLFMPAEEQYKEGLKNEAHEAGKYQDTGRAYTNFFSAVFHFPYPRFLLTVKGFYGTKVTFVLAVDTFKSSFNSNTGNFDVSISFIGYMYGIYTEIPMSYIICAPYVEPLAESSEDGLIKSKYWIDKVNDGTFKTIDGETIPTFLEFAKKYAISMTESSVNGDNSTIDEIHNLDTFQSVLNNIDNINDKLNKIYKSFEDENKTYIKCTIKDDSAQYYDFYLLQFDGVNNSLKWDAELSRELNPLINTTLDKYRSITNSSKSTHIPWLCKNSMATATAICKLSDILPLTKKDGEYVYDENTKVMPYGYVYTMKGGSDELKLKYQKQFDYKILKDGIINYLNNNKIDKIDTLYVCAINRKFDLNYFNLIKQDLLHKKGELYSEATNNAEKYLNESLNFKLSIENVFRMIFAHLECFFHLFLDETIYKIKDEKSTRTLKNLGLKQNETDIKFLDKNGKTFVPPFFGFYNIDNQEGRILSYPGESSNVNLQNLHEVQLIEKMIQATQAFAESYGKINEEIEALQISYNESENVDLFYTNGPFTNASLFNADFNPISLYDMVYGNRNPYSYLNKNSETLLMDILYLYAIRSQTAYLFRTDIGPSGLFLFSDYARNKELENIKMVFPTLHETFFREITEDNVVTKIKEYSQNKIQPIINGYLGYANLCPIYIPFDVSKEFNQDERVNFMYNEHPEYTNLKMQGIHVIEDTESTYYKALTIADIFDEYEHNDSTIGQMGEKSCFDATFYITENKAPEKYSLHKRFSYLEYDAEKNTMVFSDYTTEQGTTEKTLIEQLPNSFNEIMNDAYTLPFILWSQRDKDNNIILRNLLSDIKQNFYFYTDDNNIHIDFRKNGNCNNDICKAFFILSSIVGIQIPQLRSNGFYVGGKKNDNDFDVFYDDGSDITNENNHIYHIFSLHRRVMVLYYGCLLHIVKQKILYDKDIVPGFIQLTEDGTDFEIRDVNLTDVSFDIFYQNNEFKREGKLYDLIWELLMVSSGYYHNSAYNELRNNKDGITIKQFLAEKALSSGNTEIEEYFLESLEDNGILHELLYWSANNPLENEVKIRIQYEDGGVVQSINKLHIYGGDSNTSKILIQLICEVVCMIATPLKRFTKRKDTWSNDLDVIKPDYYIRDMYKALDEEYEDKRSKSVFRGKNNDTEANESVVNNITNNIDVKRSLYYVFKNIYDKWVCSYGNMNRFKLGTASEDKNVQDKRFEGKTNNTNVIKREINNFIFVDSLYRKIGQSFICNPSVLLNMINEVVNGQSNASMYQFLHSFCEKNYLMMRALPVYNNFYTQDGLKEIFTPRNVFNANEGMENNFASTYLIMYTHEPSKYLENSSSNYVNDGMDISRTIVTTDTESLFNGEGYVVPTFGVTYGMQNQSYFKGININMDNPITTDYSIANTLQLAHNGVKGGDLNLPIGIGQNIYSIYSNRSYNCVVEMMGCANIMPMMYFQLNNIPMFKGVYMITSVKHSIRGGNMTTTFTGVKQTSIIYPFINSSLILTSILGKVNNGYDDSIRFYNETEQYVKQKTLTSKRYGLEIIDMNLLDVGWIKHETRQYPLNQYSNERQITSIVLHYAGSRSSKKGTAKIYRTSWQKKWNKGKDKITNKYTEVSADFAVDDSVVVQYTPDIKHFSTFATADNKDKINIEMCSQFSGGNTMHPNMPQWSFSKEVLENTKKLIIELLIELKYNKSLDNASIDKLIIRHYDIPVKKDGKVYNKPCPGIKGWNDGVMLDADGNETNTNNDSTEFEKYKEEIKNMWNEYIKEKNKENVS